MRDIKRVTFNIPTTLYERINEYASSLSINMTAAVCVLTSQALDGQRTMNNLDEIVKAIKEEQAKEKGER